MNEKKLASILQYLYIFGLMAVSPNDRFSLLELSKEQPKSYQRK